MEYSFVQQPQFLVKPYNTRGMKALWELLMLGNSIIVSGLLWSCQEEIDVLSEGEDLTPSAIIETDSQISMSFVY